LCKTTTAFGDRWYENDGTVLDINSEMSNEADPYKFQFGEDPYDNYNKEGDCYNRENLIPQSISNKKDPMISNAFHIGSKDDKVNAMRRDYPFGKVGNNVNSDYSKGYSRLFFESKDEFKRENIFYFTTRYEDKIST
jgi:hypothetical protein